MRRIRIGNDFQVRWAIEREGIPEPLDAATDIKILVELNYLCSSNQRVNKPLTAFTVSGNYVFMDFTAEFCSQYGDYRIIMQYTIPDSGMIDGDRKIVTDITPFTIVGASEDADSSADFFVDTDIVTGFKGDDGLSSFEVWLLDNPTGTIDEYWDFIKMPNEGFLEGLVDYLDDPTNNIRGISTPELSSATGTITIAAGTTVKGNVDTRNSTFYADSIRLNTSATPTFAPGEIGWNADEQTVEIGLPDGGSQLVGKEMFEEYTNIDTVPLTNGMIVSTAAISGNRKGIKRTDFTNLTSIRSIVGMVTVASIGTNQSGRVATKGVIHGLNTNGIGEGSQLWGNPSVLGGWSGSKPAKPQYAVQIGQVVVAHATVGSVELNIAKDVKFSDLADVSIYEVTDGQLPVYDEATGIWKNKSEVKINSITPTGGSLDIDGDLVAKAITSDSVDTDSITSTTGFVKDGRTDADVLLAGGGHKTLVDLYKGVYKVWKPDGSAAILEINAAGQVLISGDIIVNGETYKLDAQEITTAEEQITLRRDAVGGLPIGALAGFRIKKYDGVNDGMIVIDKDGILRIGDEGEEQPVLTREESPVSNGFMYYDNSDVRAETIPTNRTKTTIADTDLFPFADSAASNLPKFIDGANLKERLKEYVGSDFLFYLGNDDISVTVGVGEHVFVSESTTGYPSVTLNLLV